MFQLKSFHMVGLSLLTATLLQGCGGSSLGDNIKVGLDPEDGLAKVEITMSDGLEVALNGEFPIADGYGKLVFVPATRQERAKIVIEADLARLATDQLDGYGMVATMPNGAPLPTPMEGPLFQVPVVKKGNITVDANFAIIPELQVGAAIGIAQFKTQYFPPGVSICQTFRNKEGLAFATICIYGPGTNVPGGVYLGANFGDVLDIDLFRENNRNALRAASSNRALLSSVRAQTMVSMDNVPEVNEESDEWDEERHDPRGRLNNSRTAYTALQNAKKILRARY